MTLFFFNINFTFSCSHRIPLKQSFLLDETILANGFTDTLILKIKWISYTDYWKSCNTTQRFEVSKIFFFFKESTIFIKQGFINVMKSDNVEVCYKKWYSFSINQKIRKMFPQKY